MSNHVPVETSVSFSLAELAKLEEDRLHHEERARTRAQAERARRDAEAATLRRKEEEARIAADADARARAERADAAERARIQARAQAAIDVARIEAEARARLEADNAARAHEIAVLRARQDRSRAGLQYVLGGLLAALVCAGSASAYAVNEHVDGLHVETERLRERQVALAREREQGLVTDLASLDRRHAALTASPHAAAAGDARTTTQAARAAIDPKAPDPTALRAFGDALDALAARVATAQKLADLDRRSADLAAWARSERRPSDAAAKVVTARMVAGAASADARALAAYERSLDDLRDALAAPAQRGGTAVSTHKVQGLSCDNPKDPICGFNGRSL